MFDFSILYGDQAKYFDMELTPRLKHRKVGTVSMVNNGGNMHGSQVVKLLNFCGIYDVIIKGGLIVILYSLLSNIELDVYSLINTKNFNHIILRKTNQYYFFCKIFFYEF